MPPYLYRYESKGIQSYVLATGRLVEIAGASALVEGLADLVGECLDGIPGAELLASGAGSATVRFPDQAALERFAASWPLIVARHAPGLRVVQAWVDENDQQGGSHPTQRLFERLLVRGGEYEVELPEAGPLLARAGRTGGPAVARDQQRSGLLDPPTRAKVRAGTGTGRERLTERLFGEEADERFLTDLGRFGNDGEGKDGEGYVAVVHIDGNDMGGLVRQYGADLDWYQRFSKAVGEATLSAVRSAVEDVLRKPPPRQEGRGPKPEERDGPRTRDGKVLRARPVVIGGDDVTWILQAKDALPFVQAFLSQFEAETRRNRELFGDADGATACAGIAFVKKGFPFASAYDLSEALCREAKRRLRRPGAPTPSGLLFHRVTSSDLADWSEIRDRELSCERGSLVFGPYVSGNGAAAQGPRLEDLLALVGSLSSIPRGAVRTWLRAIKVDPQRSQLVWDRMQEVAKGRGAWGPFAAALERLGVASNTGWRDPGESKGEAATPLLDANVLRMLGIRRPSKNLETRESERAR